MSDENEKPDEQPQDQSDIDEIVTDFGDGMRVRSGFEVTEQEPGVLGINIFGPLFEIDHDDPEDDESNCEDADKGDN